MAACKKENKCCNTTITQRAINDNISLSLTGNELQLVVGNKIYKVDLDISTGGGTGGGLPKVILPIVSNGQTSFPNVIPVNRILLGVYLNGVLTDNKYYMVTGQNLVWVNSPVGVQTITLETSDSLTLELGILDEE